MLVLLAEAELTVSDLTEILRQSQPRISRHLKLLVEAGLIERFREGAWAFFRLAERGASAELARALVARLDPSDPIALRDRERLVGRAPARAPPRRRIISARTPRNGTASASSMSPTRRWKARSARRSPSGRSARCSISAPAPAASWNCSGRSIERGLGIDLSLDMLLLARARLERAGLRHCSVRQGDIYDLAVPADSFDVVVIHQVLHFLDDGARAIREAARVLAPSGRLLVVDFAPHDLEFLREEHAHRRLGFATETVAQWMSAAGLDVTMHRSLPPEPGSDGKIAVSLWLGRDPRAAMPAVREVA